MPSNIFIHQDPDVNIKIDVRSEKACKEAGLPEPEITEKDGGVQVTLFKVANGGQINKLTDRQKEVFQLILANPKVTRKEPSEKPDINESAVQKHLKALTEQAVIERIGTKHGYWKIINKE